MKAQITVSNNLGKARIEWEYEGELAIQGLTITSPSDILVMLIEQYLETPREFNIPKTQTIDDFESIIARPVESHTFMVLALCTMLASLNVSPIWDTSKIDEPE